METPRNTFQKVRCDLFVCCPRLRLVRDQRLVLPDRFSILAPIAVERPARQLFSWIPLALTKMNQTSGAVALSNPMKQIRRQSLLIRSLCGCIPFVAVGIVDGNKGWLATHGETHVTFLQIGIHYTPQKVNRVPFLFGIGLRDARSLPDA